MRRLLLALACISLVQSCSASPTSGEARPSSTTGFRTAASSALSSRPTPVTPSHQGDLHHESFSRTPAQATLDEGGPQGSSSGSNESNTGRGGHDNEGGQEGSRSISTPARGPVRQPQRRKRRGHNPRNRGACRASAQSAASSHPSRGSTDSVRSQPESEKTPPQKEVTPQEDPQVAVASGRPTWTQPEPRVLDLSYPVVPPPSPSSSRSQCGEGIDGNDAVHDTSVNEELPTTSVHSSQNNHLNAEQDQVSAQTDPQPSSDIQTDSSVEPRSNAEPEPSSSVARDFFTLTPEGLVSNAERLAARSGYGGAGAFSSCAEKHSPYALDGYCLPEILVSPKNSRGKALIELAGTAIADELRQARILTRSQAQLRQSCIELLCYPKERLLRNAERALYEAYRKGLMRSGMCLTDDPVDPSEEEDTSEEEVDEEELAANSVESCRPGSLPWLLSREGTRWSTRIVKEHSAAWRLTSSELDYAYIRFYEYAADYNFAVVTCEFLFGLRPEPRKGFPGEQYLASPPVLRMLSSADGSPLMERKKLSLLSYQLEHITFMRQLLREKRLILADVFVTPCPEFPTFNSSNICSERLRRRRNRHASRLD